MLKNFFLYSNLKKKIYVYVNISLKRSIGGGGGQVFQGDFHMEFCDNVKQLMQAYFRDFSVERLDKPWQAFTGSWSKFTLARNLGLLDNTHFYYTYDISPKINRKR